MAPNGTLTVKDVADFLKVTPQAVYNLIKREDLAAFKVGSAVRILAADLDAYVGRGKRRFAAQNADFPPPEAGVFAARGLCARLGSFYLDAIDFAIPAGSSLGVIGQSGSGKTLLLRALAGLAPLEAGAVFLGPRRLDDLPTRERSTGLVFQDYALYPHLDGGGNIGFPLRMAKHAKPDIDPTVRRIAADLKIDEAYLSKHIDILPEGVKQLVAIGRAENKPAGRLVELFLLDEPLLHLDAQRRVEARAFLKTLVASFGATTVYAFNDAADALALSDALLVLRAGGAVQFGPTLDVFRRPADAEVMALLSLNGVVSLAADFTPGTAGEGRAAIAGFAAGLPAFAVGADGAAAAWSGPADYCYRPEETVVVPEAADGCLRARIERAVPYDGDFALATGRLVRPGHVEPAEDAPRLRFLAPEGAEGVVCFRPTAAVAFPR
jgi:multiple sugar transport system ATP-binding protein